MKKINLVLILTVMSLTQSVAEEMVEPEAVEQFEIVQPEPTAVSKVMERFSGLPLPKEEPIEKVSTPVEKEEEVMISTTDSSLAVIEPIQTAKFEDKEMPYPKSDNTNSDEVPEKVVEKTPRIEKKSKESIESIEADARKVIEEEIKKVEEAKESALERINEAMKRLEEAKNNEKESDF
jgi:hypothetical protein